MSKMVETPYIRLELLDSGILVASYKRRTLVTLEMAREIVQTRLDFVGREPRPVLIFNLGVVEVDKAARKYVSSGDGVAGIKAAATVTDNLATHFIMSFIYKFERLPMPVRNFTREDKAMEWLKVYLE
jgi:hypothetical protein